MEQAKLFMNFQNGLLQGQAVQTTQRVLKDLKGCFSDSEAFEESDLSQIVYEVQIHARETEGKEGGLFWGVSCVYPGKVGNEYFMTKGHFHLQRDTAEYYFGIQGEGVLLLMDESGKCRGEKVKAGSLHYIPGKIAHRLVNSGNGNLLVGACWPSNAGHDYGSIAQNGFSKRVFCMDNSPKLV